MVLRWEGDGLPMFKYDHCLCFLLLVNKLPQPQWINHRSLLQVPSIPALSSIGHWVQPTTAGSSPPSLGSVKSRVDWPGLEFGGSEEKSDPELTTLSSGLFHWDCEGGIFVYLLTQSQGCSFLLENARIPRNMNLHLPSRQEQTEILPVPTISNFLCLWPIRWC